MRTTHVSITTALAALAAIVSGAAACSGYSPSLPEEPFLCGSGDACPDGYSCETSGTERVCLHGGSGGSDGVDSGTNPDCTGDSSLEPNNTTATSYPTPVATQRSSLTLADLLICPTGDLDYYGFDITSEGQNVAAMITYGDSGAPLRLSVLGPLGDSQDLKDGAVTGTDQVSASVANLPAGHYFVKVVGPTAGGTNTYTLQLDVTGP